MSQHPFQSSINALPQPRISQLPPHPYPGGLGFCVWLGELASEVLVLLAGNASLKVPLDPKGTFPS